MSLFRFEHRAMACRWEILVPNDGRDPAHRDELEPWLAEAFEELDRLEGELSRFLEASDVRRIARLSDGASTVVGLDTLRCLELGLELLDVTGGHFDIARGTGLERLRLDRTARRVAVEGPAIDLDLGGIGKGYAIDRLAELIGGSLLDDWGHSGFLVHGGQSSVRAVGASPSGEPWSVALRNPQGDEVHRVSLCDAVLSGSANELKGAHVVDPHSGRAPDRERGAWAVAADGAWSDALSTTLLLLDRSTVSSVLARAADRVDAVEGFVWEAGAIHAVLG